MYWVDVPGQWDQQWNHTFSSKIVRPERIEISGGSNGMQIIILNSIMFQRIFGLNMKKINLI